MADNTVYTGLTVEVRKFPDSDTYRAGVVCDGAFVAFGEYKAGGFEEDVAEGKQALADAEKTAADAAATPADGTTTAQQA